MVGAVLMGLGGEGQERLGLPLKLLLLLPLLLPMPLHFSNQRSILNSTCLPPSDSDVNVAKLELILPVVLAPGPAHGLATRCRAIAPRSLQRVPHRGFNHQRASQWDRPGNKTQRPPHESKAYESKDHIESEEDVERVNQSEDSLESEQEDESEDDDDRVKTTE
ncbi:hypothetical protein EYF80_014092 [Liparis tanakae]|uniref:Uncharacterized protein n=1 Tax=Liparis tanakae TaxID=230148 RepID=A0A4Z2ICE7_9TELE|nr:hypothetical protein EYF80_014092 [Liparis tanakae]